jgi:hypothetical protein
MLEKAVLGGRFGALKRSAMAHRIALGLIVALGDPAA